MGSRVSCPGESQAEWVQRSSERVQRPKQRRDGGQEKLQDTCCKPLHKQKSLKRPARDCVAVQSVRKKQNEKNGMKSEDYVTLVPLCCYSVLRLIVV